MCCKLLRTINVPAARVAWEWNWVWTLIKWLTDSRKEARCIRWAEGRGLGWPSERGLFTECVTVRVCVCLYVRHVARSNVAFIARKFCIFLLARFFHALHSLFSVCISISVLCLSLSVSATSPSLSCFLFCSLLLLATWQWPWAAATRCGFLCLQLLHLSSDSLSLSLFPLLPSHPFPTLPPTLPAAPSIVPNVPSHHVGRYVASGVLKNVIDLFPSQLWNNQSVLMNKLNTCTTIKYPIRDKVAK